MKFCPKCATDKQANEFYKNRTSRDGLQSYCKQCWKADCDARKARDPERRRQISRDSARRRVLVKPKRVWAKKPYDDKEKARRKLQGAVKRGKTARQPCRDCGAPSGDAHHHDYSKPLDVIWLCRICHEAEHRMLAALAANDVNAAEKAG